MAEVAYPIDALGSFLAASLRADSSMEAMTSPDVISPTQLTIR
jgi:hypothetical protein